MIESGYYAPGTEFLPEAPWNEKTIPEKTFRVAVSQSLSKSVEVTTDDYNPEYCEEDGTTYYATQATDWWGAFKKEHMTPKELIASYASHLKEEMLRLGNAIDKKRFQYLINECNNWIVDDSEITED